MVTNIIQDLETGLKQVSGVSGVNEVSQVSEFSEVSEVSEISKVMRFALTGQFQASCVPFTINLYFKIF